MLEREARNAVSLPLNLPTISTPLPWQSPEWARLGGQLASGQFPHALLLAGPEGLGKVEFTVALARLLLCHQPADGLNCGQCSACNLSANGSHGDFRWLGPEEKSRFIKVEQVRLATDFISRTASYGPRKVLVLQPADAMNASSANALLKCLEEPAGETVIILVCQRLHALPATVRSRCQMLKFAIPDGEVVTDWLDKVTGDRLVSNELLQLADLRPLSALAIFEGGAAESITVRNAALDALISGQVAVPQVRAALAGEDLEANLSLLTVHLQNLLRGLGAEQLRSERARDLYVLLDELARNRAALSAGSNPNQDMMLDNLLSRLATVG